MRDEAQFDSDGRLTSKLYGDIYFSGDGVQETEHVFVAGNALPERFAKARGTFVVGETGFGTGLNFLMTAECFTRHASTSARLVFVTTEQHPLTRELLAAAHAQLPERLQAHATELREAFSPPTCDSSQRIAFADGRIVLHVLFGDATESLRTHSFAADAWFLDGFAPDRNPAMWSFDILREVANHTVSQGTLATYTVAGHVRRNLQDAGFAIERAKGFGKKREMLCGIRKPFKQPANASRLAEADHAVPQHVHVLGAGIAGATAAHAFAERGARVTVIDPHGIASAASGIQAAIVRPRLWIAGNRVPDAEMLAQAFRYTVDWLTNTAADRFRACGALLCATDASDAERLQKRATNAATADLASWLTAEQASERGGTRIPYGAAWIPSAGTCDLAGLAHDLLQHPNIEVRSDAPEASADLTVLATGNTQHDSALDLRTQPIRGQAIAVRWPPTNSPPRTVLCTSGYLAPPSSDGITWIGSTFDRDDIGRDLRVSDDARIRGHFAALPDLADTLTHSDAVVRFAAVRNATNDRLPMIGTLVHPSEIPTVASLAHGSRGAVTAPWAASLLAGAAFAEPLPLSSDYWQRLLPARP
ncbi:MAG: tRNA 5-methylaminomethyl-2-thiouridine biosynthesis bifunctional protein [Planctomycetota bacterium]|jgi:tRNA 5-methylaminomethyl-2-thiouridine biosynthesis bifunctional protein